MDLTPYKRVLAAPGVRTLLLVGLLARIPVTATGMTLTMHVLHDMKLSFTQAGLVGAIITVGMAISAPVAGRFIDKKGLRPVIAITTLAQLAFWLTAPALPYLALLVSAALSGLLTLPLFSVIRQCVAAVLPVERRRTGFALDSMAVELSYMIGPAAGVGLVLGLGSGWALALVGFGLVAAGTALLVLNPPTRSAEEDAESADAPVVPRRQWLGMGVITLLGTVSALTFVLTATELSLVAVLKEGHATEWTGLVIGLWCFYSLVGGFVYGGLPRALSPLLLTAGLCAFTAPLGLVTGGWGWLCLALIPAGLLCAPALASSVDALTQWTPPSVRGEAMGLHSTALTIGMAAAGPVAGAVIDGYGPGWAFLATGVLAAVFVLVAMPFWRRAPRAVKEPGPAPASA
ncbi:MFS transporter [Spongiactinospora gelatinilytica]|uniref:MFS transporter n=1 Tax=Spongiactinospora gelatinilytica TaxID=2666298 RepID=A0A2W2GCQ0_9ACTN|nr:MFS transporter [Spongiactinospora gelatinilytica]PZG32027.1 MFS transporter [Spongiactinospora gelatinilytica]